MVARGLVLMGRLAAPFCSLLALVLVLLVAAGCGAVVEPSVRGPEPATQALPEPSAAGTVAPSQSPMATTVPPTPAPTVVPSPTPAPSPVLLVSHGSRETRTVALTFDDGWSSKNVLAILAILQTERIPATFFPVAAAVGRSPDTWRTVAAARYPIGNHSRVHKHLTRLSRARVAADLDGARKVIEESIGGPILPVLRPPYGNVNAVVRGGAADAGLALAVTWDVDTRDWTGRPYRKVATAGASGRPGSVVLFHCDDNTVKALPIVIQRYKARGFRFVTVGQMFGVVGDVPYFRPATPARRVGFQPAPGLPQQQASSSG
jgi:peptidoglycan-N-acetylglucosamine deacetylase